MNLAPDQVAALKLFTSHRHLAVFGEPGTGKTELRNAFAKHHNCIVLGPTGTSVKGVKNAYTIARFLGATTKTSGDPGALAKNFKPPCNLTNKVLVIDEIGMVSAFDFVALDAGLRRSLKCVLPFGGCRVILLGDLFQLRPPTQAAVKYFFQTSAYNDLKKDGLHVHSLTTQHRQRAGVNGNTDFIPFLKEARQCALGVDSRTLLLDYMNNKFYSDDALHIYSLKKDADKHNRRCMKSHGLRLQAICGFEFTIGARVVLTRNIYKKRVLLYTNGTLGYIVEASAAKKQVTVKIQGESVEITPFKDGVLPLALAWATTIHKVQGKTLNSVVVHGDGMFEAGQAYVAVSRARSLRSLATRNLHPDDFAIPFPPELVQYARENNLT